MHYNAYTGPALPEVQVLGKWGRHPRGCCRCRERPRGALGHPVLTLCFSPRAAAADQGRK